MADKEFWKTVPGFFEPPSKITPAILKAVREFIGEDSVTWFRHVKGLKGEINTVLRLNVKKRRVPVHPIHLREGMQIRNYLRSLPDTVEWSFEDFESLWIDVIEELIKK